MAEKIERKGICREFVYPLEFAGEDIERWHPSSFFGMSVRDVCALSRSNEDQIYEILEDNGVANEAYSAMAISQMTKDGYDVYDTEVYRDGDKMIVVCYALLPENRGDGGFVHMISLN